MRQSEKYQRAAGMILGVFLIVLAFSGCVYFIVGSAGAVGGYAISSDTVQGNIQREYGEVWDATASVVNIMGKLVKENEDDGQLEAIISNARVKVIVTQFTPKLVRLTVKARKVFFPSPATAQDVYMKIISQLGS